MALAAPVLIVGAGPTGLTLAHELARRGVPFRLVEKLPEPSPLSRALGIHARTREVFDLMGGGIAEEVAARGVAMKGACFHLAGGREARIDLDGLPSRHQGAVCLPQADTEAILAAALSRHGGTVERGVTLESLREEADGVTTTLRRVDGSTEEIRFAWIVGCDGAHSTVRKAIGVGFTGAVYPSQFVLADVELDGPLDRNYLHAFPSARGRVACFPLPGGLWRVVASVEGGPLREGEPALEEIQAWIDERCPMKLRLSAPRWKAWFRTHHRIASALRSPGGRVFLCGDAAHIHSPLGGQGMNTGIQDAFNLGWKLARVVQGGPESLLATYEPERLPVARDVVTKTDRMMRMSAIRFAPLRAAQAWLMPWITRFPLVRKRAGLALSQLGVHYRGGPLSEDHPAPHSWARAGERWPDPTGLSGDGGWTALAHTAGAPAPHPAVEEIRRRFGLAVSLWESPGKTFGEGIFCLVRPDGYVGLRCPLEKAAELLPAYLAKI